MPEKRKPPVVQLSLTWSEALELKTMLEDNGYKDTEIAKKVSKCFKNIDRKVRETEMSPVVD